MNLHKIEPVRFFIVIGLTILVSASCFAQVNISLSGGANFPLGDFASMDVEKDGAGMAMTGITSDLSVGIPVYKKLGIAGTVRGQWNNFNTKPFEEFPTVYSMPGTVTANANPWRSLHFLIGPYYEFQLGKNLALALKLQGGVAFTDFPDVELFNTLSSGFIAVEYNSYSASSESSFSALLGAALMRKISQRFSLGLSIDYLQSAPTFNLELTRKVVLGDGETTSISNSKKEWSQELKGLNAMISVCYAFQKK